MKLYNNNNNDSLEFEALSFISIRFSITLQKTGTRF